MVGSEAARALDGSELTFPFQVSELHRVRGAPRARRAGHREGINISQEVDFLDTALSAVQGPYRGFADDGLPTPSHRRIPIELHI